MARFGPSSSCGRGHRASALGVAAPAARRTRATALAWPLCLQCPCRYVVGQSLWPVRYRLDTRLILSSPCHGPPPSHHRAASRHHCHATARARFSAPRRHVGRTTRVGARHPHVLLLCLASVSHRGNTTLLLASHYAARGAIVPSPCPRVLNGFATRHAVPSLHLSRALLRPPRTAGRTELCPSQIHHAWSLPEQLLVLGASVGALLLPQSPPAFN